MHYYLDVLKKYAVFQGRAARKEYWMFVLFNFLFSIVLMVVDSAAGLTSERGWGVLGTIYSLGVFVPSLALAIRRLHDIGKSGWWYLLIFVPIVGWIVLFVFSVLDSQIGQNQYGPNPKGVQASVPTTGMPS